jgi:hypothetical protein
MDIQALKDCLPKLSGKDFEFASSLISAHARWGGLTAKQTPWVGKLIARANGEDKPQAVRVGDLAPILELFNRATKRLKRPAIVLSTPETGTLRVSIAGERSKFPGSLSVTGPGTFDDRAWFGRVAIDGTFVPGRDAAGKETVLAGVLSRFAAEPAQVAAEHGRLHGACCFCNLPLKDARSTAVGYGPTCAENYGMPWN